MICRVAKVILQDGPCLTTLPQRIGEPNKSKGLPRPSLTYSNAIVTVLAVGTDRPSAVHPPFVQGQRSTTLPDIGASLASKRFCAAKGTCASRMACWRFSTSAFISALVTPMPL